MRWSINRRCLHRPCRPVGLLMPCRLTSKIRAPMKTEELFKKLLVEFAKVKQARWGLTFAPRDSLSQIVLGAAVGEAVLGKKQPRSSLGALWRHLASRRTSSDNFALSELDNFAFHRGISHSLTATVLGSLFFGWATDWLYRCPPPTRIAGGQGVCGRCPRVCGNSLNFRLAGFAGGAVRPIGGMDFGGTASADTSVYRGSDRTDFKGWVQLFFWGFLTHILLDCGHVRDAGVPPSVMCGA